MLSRRNILLSLMSFSLFIGCSYIFEEKKETKVVAVQNDVASCLEHTPEVFDTYFDDLNADAELLDNNIRELTKCYQFTVQEFGKLTKGGSGNGEVYSAQEIANFVERIYRKRQFSLAFIENALIIKQFLIGGSEKGVTKKELSKLDSIISVFGEAFLRLRPYRNVLFFEKSTFERTPENRKHFFAAMKAVERSKDKFVQVVNGAKSDRLLDLNEIGQFILHTVYKEKAQEKVGYLKLFVKFKNLALNDDGSKLVRKDFKLLADQSFDTFSSISEYMFLMEDKGLFNHIGTLASFISRIPTQLKHGKVMQTETLDSLNRILDRAVVSLRKSAKRNKQHGIPMSRITESLKALEEVELINGPLSAETLGLFLSRLVEGWGIDSNLKGPYLTRNKIRYTEKKIKNWRIRQNYLNKKFEDRESITYKEFARGAKREAVKEWLQVVKKINVKHWDENNRLVVTRDSREFNYQSLLVSNSLFTEVDFFMRPFQRGQGIKTLDFTIEKDNAQSVYLLMRILGVKLAVMDPRISNSGERAFEEANLFSTQRQNDSVMDVYEAFELMTILYSAGHQSEVVHENVPEDCKKTEGIDNHLDILNKQVLNHKCFRNYFKNSYAQYFNQLQGLTAFYNSSNQQGQFVEALEVASRKGVLDNKPFDMGDIRIMVSLSYYLQATFFNFDYNNDSHLHGQELMDAEEHFRPFLKEYAKDSIKSGDLKEQHLPDVFAFLLKEGKLPNSDTGAKVWWMTNGFWIWKTGYLEWMREEANVSYLDVLKVFAALGNMERKNEIKKISKFLDGVDEQTGTPNKYKVTADAQVYKELFSKTKQIECSSDHQSFCEFSKLVNCNIDIYPVFAEWIYQNEVIFRENSVSEMVETLDERMRGHKDLSTRCRFPTVKVRKDKKKNKKIPEDIKHDY